ncbi:MAG TPA: hypothetical protein VFS75_03870, partial [Candidatus Paceibacterota bacterium]|nr:hypothetical protein [Candidatus Paceibacterota bacterium]
MINLIPPEGQQAVKREYLLRVGGTLAFLFGGVLLALAVSLLPTYVLVDAQISASASNARKAGADDEQFKSADLEVSRTSAILNQLQKTPPQPPMSAAIEDIRAVAPAGIGFRNFFIEDDAGKVSKVQVQGVAATREVL